MIFFDAACTITLFVINFHSLVGLGIGGPKKWSYKLILIIYA